jgi:hypothetical protein
MRPRGKQGSPAIGSATNLEKAPIRKFAIGESKITFGALGNANHSDLALKTFPTGRNVANRHPIRGRTDENDIVENVDQPDEKGLLHLLRLIADPVAQGVSAAGFVNRGGLFEPGFEDFVVFAADGGGKKIVSEGQEGDAAEREDESIPETQSDADVPAQIKQA